MKSMCRGWRPCPSPVRPPLLSGISIGLLLVLAVHVHGATRRQPPPARPHASSRTAAVALPKRPAAVSLLRRQTAVPGRLKHESGSRPTVIKRGKGRQEPPASPPQQRPPKEQAVMLATRGKAEAPSIRTRVLRATVQGSLYSAIRAQGGSARLVDDLADIFTWDLNLRTDLRAGDTIRLLTEERAQRGTFLYRRILAADIRSRGRIYQAVYHQPADDEEGGYYRPDGRSLQRMFLSAPVRYTRISSAFSSNRLHPVLKRYRPHLGIDYAAPTGTPVRSVGDGVVTWAGMKGAGGKTVEIRHNATYSTYYLHLSRLASDLRVGKEVEQGQIIGYVGATGLATGPHLDFRLARNGNFLNPLAHQDIAAPGLSQEALRTFQAQAKRLLATLDTPEATGK